MKFPKLADLVRLIEVMDRHPRGAVLMIVLAAVVVAGCWAWRS